MNNLKNDQENVDSSNQASIVPSNWEEIAAVRLQMLDLDYQECQNAQIKGDPNDFKGLQYVLDQTDVVAVDPAIEGLQNNESQDQHQNAAKNKSKQVEQYNGKDQQSSSSSNKSESDNDDDEQEDEFDDFQEGGYRALNSDNESQDEEDQPDQEKPDEKQLTQVIPQIPDDEPIEDFKDQGDIFTQSFQNKEDQLNNTNNKNFIARNEWDFKKWDEIDEDKLQNARAIEKKPN
eukprot:403357095